MRIGFGFDVHRLEDNRPFWLGGILIDHHKGATGHSDADVIIHALCDAMLGAANLGDIGKHFPDTSAEFRGIDSKILLSRVCELVKVKGYELGNADITLCLEAPKIISYVDRMKEVLAKVMGVTTDQISVKATTNERLGYIGRQEGVACYAVVLLLKSQKV